MSTSKTSVTHRHNAERRRRRLRHGWPLVGGLLLLVLVEHVLAAALHFAITPLDWLLPRSVAVPLWEGLLWVLFGVAVVLCLTRNTAGELRWTYLTLGVFTGTLVLNVVELVSKLPERAGADALYLLGDGVLIWGSNVLVFAMWYWLLDGGGSERRAEGQWARRDFLFPQQAAKLGDYPHWQPAPMDYLFLAFSTSTALSPADTQTLSRRAKGLQMMQASIALAVSALIVARAINILSTGQG